MEKKEQFSYFNRQFVEHLYSRLGEFGIPRERLCQYLNAFEFLEEPVRVNNYGGLYIDQLVLLSMT